MPKSIETTSLIVSINSYFTNTDPNIRSKDLENIKAWFSENKLGAYKNDEVTATSIAHILNKSELFNGAVKNSLDKLLKIEAEKVLDFLRSTEDANNLHDEFIKYRNKYYDEPFNAQAIEELNNKMNEALGCLAVNAISKDSLITLSDILKNIQEKRLNTIKEYLKGIGKTSRMIKSISKIKDEDDIKKLFEDSVLSKYIQSSTEVINRSDSEVDDDIAQDTDLNDSSPNDFDRTDETYKFFLKDIKSLQSRYDNLNKQEARAIDKALWVLASTDKQIDRTFKDLKKYRTDKLKIDLSVTEDNNKFKIRVNQLDRISNGNENNHIVPVSVFLKSLKYSLGKQEFGDIKTMFNKLCYLYGMDYEKSIIFEFLKDKINNTSNLSNLELRFLLEDSIIPFIYFYWNERVEATYKMAKTKNIFGKEGDKIKKFNKDLKDLYENFSGKSFRVFEKKIDEIVKNYFEVIDVKIDEKNGNIDIEKFNIIVGDAIEMLRIWFNLFGQNEKLLFHTQKEDYRNLKKKYLAREEFGKKLIQAQDFSIVKKDRFEKTWKEYTSKHYNILVDERSSEGVSSFSDLDQKLLSPGRSDSGSSMDTDHKLEEFYNKENIEKILSKGLNNKLINIDISKLVEEQRNKLIKNLKEDFDNSSFEEKIYVIGLENNIQEITAASIIKITLRSIDILPLITHKYSIEFYNIISQDGAFENLDVNICSKKGCGSLMKEEKLEIGQFVEIAKLKIQDINSEIDTIKDKINFILKKSVQALEDEHRSIITGVIHKVSEVTSTKKLRKRVQFNIEDLEKNKDNIGLKASGSSCSTRSPSKKRPKRDLCQEDESEEIFPYEPLEENVAEFSRINTRLYSQIAYLTALKHLDPADQNIKPDNVLTYVTNIGDIISEGEINHSVREQELLKTHYQEAQSFFNQYPKDIILDLVGAEIDLSSRAWIFDNGKHSLLVSYDKNRYQIYSPDLNYRQSFQTKEGVSFEDIELYAEAFFKWRSNSIEYDLFVLKSNVPEEITNKIKQAKFWSPDQVVSDLVLLDKGSFSNIAGIPAKVIRELFLLNAKVPELAALHENFFAKYSGKISIRVEELHNVLSFLTPQVTESLVDLVKQYNFPIDTAYLDNMTESTKSLLHSYHNEISNKFKTSVSITIKDLSNLSWQILEKEMTGNLEISSELRELSLKNVKELHSVAATRAHALGITSQTLFFLPDIIKSMNTGNFEGLQKTGEMMLGDMAFNRMYDSLISKLELVLPEGRIALLKKLPLTSPIFKILTIHSIIELHKQLNSLQTDSEEAGIIKHQLGEQYFTIGLMVAELFGLELGPLWIGLMAEQLVYGARALRKQYHLDIPLSEAFLMNLGFDQDKLQSIRTERQLVDLNLSLVDMLSNQTNTSYGLVIVKVPKILLDEPQAENTVVEFKPKNSRFCMEDNVFLEKNSGYNRISSVIIDEQNNNCVETAPLKISGDGLSALYANNNSTEQQSIYINFDSYEGNMKLYFSKEGLNALDKLNNNQKHDNATNLATPYVVTAQICNKPYPDQIRLARSQNYTFTLNDDTSRVVSNYYIDATSPFRLEDDAISTQIRFLNKKLFEGYNAHISGNISNLQVMSIYSDKIITGHIVLKNKDDLKLNLEHILINGTLTIDIPNIEILYAKGTSLSRASRNDHVIEINPNVKTFKILLEAPSISRIDIKNNGASDSVIDMRHNFNKRSFTLSLQAIHTDYKSYYTVTVDNLQPVLDKMAFTNITFPERFTFLCNSRGSVKGWCTISNDPKKNIILIKGKINEKHGTLTIEDSKSVLEIIKNTKETSQDNKYIEVVNYGNVVKIEDNLKFNQVLEHTNYNSSAYYNYLNKHKFTNWNIIKLISSDNRTILYHFKYSKVQINEIDYFIKENKIYAIPEDNMDGNKLLKDHKEWPIPIFVGTTLNNSQISLGENSIEINNSTLHNLSDKTVLVFQKSNNKTLPLSFKLLKDSFKVIDNTKQNQDYTTEFQQSQEIKRDKRNIDLTKNNHDASVSNNLEINPIDSKDNLKEQQDYMSSSASRSKSLLESLYSGVKEGMVNLVNAIYTSYLSKNNKTIDPNGDLDGGEAVKIVEEIPPYYQAISKNHYNTKVNTDTMELEPVLPALKEVVDHPISFRHYQPDERGLQIYHNDESNIGLVDLGNKSILGFNMEIVDNSLVLLHKGNPFVKVENWNVDQSTRRMVFAFNGTTTSDLECISSVCDPRGIIKGFKKAKLSEAAKQGDLNIVKKLMTQDVGLCTQSSIILYRACMSNRFNIVKYLIEEACVETEVSIDDAARYAEIIECLQKSGVTEEKVQSLLDTRLFDSVKQSNVYMIKYLVHKGANVNATDSNGSTPLTYAAKGGHLSLEEYLMEKGASYSDDIFNATENGYLGIVRYLINKDYNIKSSAYRIIDKQNNIARQIVCYQELFNAIVINNNVDGNKLFHLAYSIKKTMARYDNSSQIISKLEALKDKLPKSVKNIVFSQQVCIKNIRFNEYLYAAVDPFNYDDDRRRVFTWIPKNDNSSQFKWQIEDCEANVRKVIDVVTQDNPHETNRSPEEMTNKSNNVTTDMNEHDTETYREGIVHENTIRNRRSVEENVTSSAARAGSMINDLVGWVKSSVNGLFNSIVSRIPLEEESGISNEKSVSGNGKPIGYESDDDEFRYDRIQEIDLEYRSKHDARKRDNKSIHQKEKQQYGSKKNKEPVIHKRSVDSRNLHKPMENPQQHGKQKQHCYSGKNERIPPLNKLIDSQKQHKGQTIFYQMEKGHNSKPIIDSQGSIGPNSKPIVSDSGNRKLRSYFGKNKHIITKKPLTIDQYSGSDKVMVSKWAERMNTGHNRTMGNGNRAQQGGHFRSKGQRQHFNSQPKPISKVTAPVNGLDGALLAVTLFAKAMGHQKNHRPPMSKNVQKGLQYTEKVRAEAKGLKTGGRINNAPWYQ